MQKDAPAYLRCSLTDELMDKPVLTKCGKSYDEKQLKKARSRDCQSKKEWNQGDYYPNHRLLSLVKQFKKNKVSKQKIFLFLQRRIKAIYFKVTYFVDGETYSILIDEQFQTWPQKLMCFNRYIYTCQDHSCITFSVFKVLTYRIPNHFCNMTRYEKRDHVFSIASRFNFIASSYAEAGYIAGFLYQVVDFNRKVFWYSLSNHWGSRELRVQHTGRVHQVTLGGKYVNPMSESLSQELAYTVQREQHILSGRGYCLLRHLTEVQEEV